MFSCIHVTRSALYSLDTAGILAYDPSVQATFYYTHEQSVGTISFRKRAGLNVTSHLTVTIKWWLVDVLIADEADL